MSQRLSPLVYVPQYFGAILFDRRTSRYMPFDSESSRVLKQCAEHPFHWIVANQTDSQRRNELIDFFQHFDEAGFFDLNGRLDAAILDVQPPSGHLVGPLAVHLEVIGACNLTCTHCFAGELPRNDNPLSLDEIRSLFRELAEMGSYRLGLTGGEPLLRADLFEILDMAAEFGLHPCLTTNGLIMDEDISRELGKRDFTWLNVSLEGSTAASNDKVRGEGVFDQVIEHLRILRKHARFTIAFTLTSANVAEAQDCARLARELGAANAVFRPLYPVGVAQQHPELMPEYSDYLDALRGLGSLDQDGDIHNIDPFSPLTREDTRSKVVLNNGCGAANLISSISVQGDVNPCSFLGPEFNAGNLREKSFREIWNNSHNFVQMRSWSKAADCGSCGEGGFQGGCRARAQSFNGHANAADPWHTDWLKERSRLHPMSNLEILNEQ